MQNNIYGRILLSDQEDEKAVRCATEQAAIDLADLNVIEANVSSRTDPLAHVHLRQQNPHWYIRVTMRHCSEGSDTHVLYRVWFSEGGWKAALVGWILPKRERCL